jgi:RNA polymerase sigma-70 factor (ECF subfamily)
MIVKDAADTQTGTCHQGRDRLDEIVMVANQRRQFLHRMALRYLRNAAEAEDAVQDALLLAIKKIDQFKGDAPLSTWITRIVINVSLMRIRRRSREPQVSVDASNWNEDNQLYLQTFVDDHPDPEKVLCREESSDRLRQMARRLSPSLRQTHQLRDIHELSIRETANILGISEAAVKARATRARQKLKKLMLSRA